MVERRFERWPEKWREKEPIKIEKEADRGDQTKSLGKDLTPTELRVYLFINGRGTNPVPVYDISREVFKEEKILFTRKERARTWTFISRIRKKMGKEAIITHFNEGYTTRRAEIEALVSRNKKAFS